MILHKDVKQYSPAWWDLRLGIATASRFSSIITAKKMTPSAARTTLIAALIVERTFGKPSDFKEGAAEAVFGFERDGTPWMKRGSDVEDEARVWYQMHRMSAGDPVEITEVGFVTTDDGEAGCSPDGLVMDGGEIVSGLEIKCRSAALHVQYILGYKELLEMPQILKRFSTVQSLLFWAKKTV